MKTTDFINTYVKENPEEISMVVNNLHTIMRVTADLAKRVKGSEDLDEWCKEKIAVAKSMMVTVEDYIASQQEMGQEEPTTFDVEKAERMFAESLNESDAGGTCSSSIAVSMTSLNKEDKGSFSRNDVIKRLGSYGSKPLGAGPVKFKAPK